MHNRFSLFLILLHTPFTSPGPKGLWGMNMGCSLGWGGPLGAGERLRISEAGPRLWGTAPWPPQLVPFQPCHRLQHCTSIIIHVSSCISLVLLIMFAGKEQ